MDTALGMRTVDIRDIKIGYRSRKELRKIPELAASIADVGQLQPIGIDPDYNLVLGQRRLEAIRHLGRDTIKAVILNNIDDALKAAKAERDENSQREPLTPSEAIAEGMRIEELEKEAAKKRMTAGINQHTEPGGKLPQGTTGKSRDKVGDAIGMSGKTYETGKKVLESGSDELIQAMDSKTVSISAAADIATLPKEKQAEMVAKGPQEILAAAKSIRTERAKVKQEEVKELQRKALEVSPPQGKYRTIVIDPPWEVQKIERDVRPNQAKELDYPTMTNKELAEFKLPSADECHLYCWTTQKYLPVTFGLLNEWGFKYVFTMVWHKNGGPQPFRLPQYNCEFIVFGWKGSMDFLDTKQFFTAFNAPRREHSRKPDEFYDLVRRVSPGPRIDIFSREKRDGFDQYGNETDRFEGAA